MPPSIRIESYSADAPVDITTAASGIITIGREPENTIVVDSTALSRRHGFLFSAGSQWIYTDGGSTNGSWVNGIQVTGEQLRLVRDGDVLQLADFAMRLHLEGASEAAEFQSLLVFSNSNFQREFSLSTESARLVVGGPEGDLFVDENPGDRPELVVALHGGQIELTVSKGTVPVHVNGRAVAGVSDVIDRDVIAVGPYVIIVNDGAFAKEHAGAQQQLATPGAEYQMPPVARGSGPEPESWQEGAPKQGLRNYVFGTPIEEEDTMRTIAVGQQEFRSHLGLHHRFGDQLEKTRANDDFADRLLFMLGLILFGAIIVVVLLLFL